MKKKTLLSIISLFVFLLFVPSFVFAFTEKNIISPLPGAWKNRQALVLNITNGEEVFYSLSGTDPLEYGISYDGPVLLDTDGEVEVRIASVMPDGRRTDFFIKYTVDEYDETESLDAEKFIRSIRKNPVLEYRSGEIYNMPEDLSYSFDGFVQTELNTPLFLSGENTLERYVSCVMSSLHGEDFYHFVIHIVPAHRKKNRVKSKLPFEISEWENFSFLDRKYIYRIDDGEWLSPDALRTIDRTSDHRVSWQSVEYQASNTVYEYVLPAKPLVSVMKNSDGTVTFTLEGDERYSFAGEIRKSLADAFPFEDIKGPAILEIFCDGFSNGFIASDFEIDRLPPPAPLIESSAGNDISRETALVEISAEKGSNIFYSVTGPLDASSFMDSDFENDLSNLDGQHFKPYFGGNISLNPSGENTVLYAIKSYAVDSSGNKGPSAVRTVIIDDTNYYVNTSAVYSEAADGTKEKPFSSFEDFLSVLDKAEKKLRLHIIGDIELPSREICFNRNCSLEGNGSVIMFDEETVFNVSGCELKISDCILEKRCAVKEEPLIRAEKAILSLSGCEFSGVYSGKGLLLEALKSAINIDFSGFTVKGGPYASCISAEETMILCEGSRFTSSAEVCVNVSLYNSMHSKSSFTDSTFTVIGNVGRGIEGIKSAAIVRQNEFVARLAENTRTSTAIWSDTKAVESIENQQKGF